MSWRVLVFLIALSVGFAGCIPGCRLKPLRPAPARDASVPCPPGHKQVCLGQCAPLVMSADETCTVNECAPDARVCRDDQVCVPDSPTATTGRCQPANILCNPTVPAGAEGNRCPATMICVPLSPTGERACGRSFQLASRMVNGICRIPQHDGERCDSEWETARASNGMTQPPSEGPLCLPCAPGLRCWRGRCRRPCGTSSQAHTRDGGGLEGGIMDAGAPDASDASDAELPDGTELEANLGLCPQDPPEGYRYRCEENSRLLGRIDEGSFSIESALLCTTCATVGHRCPAPTYQSQPVERRETRTIGQDQVIVDFGPPGTNLCCDSGAACVNGRCCMLPGTACQKNEECCGLPSHGSFCCSDARNTGLVALACSNQRGQCITCGGTTGVPCPPGAGCSRSADCAEGYNCVDGRCQPCGASGDPCCERAPACRAAGQGCVNGRCAPCGGQSQPCCDGQSCTQGFECRNGLCQRPRCRQDNDCPRDRDYRCQNGLCLPCGGREEPCCSDGRCNHVNDQCIRGWCSARCGR